MDSTSDDLYMGFTDQAPEEPDEATLELARQTLAAMLAQKTLEQQPPHIHKTPSPGIQKYRGKNHVLISRRSKRVSVRARLRKLLECGKFKQVHVHGLGAAVALAVAMSAELVQESDGTLVAHARTSTEALVDQYDELRDDGRTAEVRHNSAIHITLQWTG